MGWNGAGTFSRLYNFVNDAAAGIKILASKQDGEWNNVVTGMNNVLCRDGQNKPSANIDWNAKKITNLANGTASGDAAAFGQIMRATGAKSTGNTNLVSASETNLSLDLALSDGLSEWTTGVNAKWTASATGNYMFALSSIINFGGANIANMSSWQLFLKANGVTYIYGSSYTHPGATGVYNGSAALAGVWVLGLSATEYVQFRISGAAFTVATPVANNTCAFVHRLG